MSFDLFLYILKYKTRFLVEVIRSNLRVYLELLREIVFFAESCTLHLVQKYARNDLDSGLLSVYFIASAERMLNYIVD